MEIEISIVQWAEDWDEVGNDRRSTKKKWLPLFTKYTLWSKDLNAVGWENEGLIKDGIEYPINSKGH